MWIFDLEMQIKNEFHPRRIESVIREGLSDTPIVCLLGPRQCGKSTLVENMFPNRAYVSLDIHREFLLASEDPDGFISRLPDVVTIDEVQRVPELINAIKYSVDRDRRPGRFLLTGSVNLLLVPRLTETLAGRMEIIELQPLSESEKSHSSGDFLSDLLENNLKPSFNSGQTIVLESTIEERIKSGGFVEPLLRDAHRARRWRTNYIRSVVERDVAEVFRIRNPKLLSRLIELLAWRTGQLLNVSELASSLQVNRITVEQYLAYLERVYIVRRLYAWHSNDTKRLIKSPKIHFIDCGLAAMLTDMPGEDWEENRLYMGRLLESFVVQQIIAQAGWTNPDLRIWHYRDKDQVEVDAVITLGRRTWGIEIKLTSTPRAKDTAGLMRLSERCGDRFQKGVLFYNGVDILPFAKGRILAVPISELWER